MSALRFRTIEDADLAAPSVIAHLMASGVIAYPTETVYGLGTLLDTVALEDLAQLKGRDGGGAFLLLSHQPLSLEGLHWTPAAKYLASAFWPGPLTIAIQADETVYQPPVLSAGGTVAVRHTSHPPLLRLLERLGAPLTSTSLNVHGAPPARDVSEAMAVLRDLRRPDIPLLDGGTLYVTAPSTIVDCSGMKPRLIREGAVPSDALRARLAAGGFDFDV